MAQAKTIPMTRHPFADGSYKQMLIDGKWVDAASGKTFRDPQSGDRRTAGDGRRRRRRGHQPRRRRRPRAPSKGRGASSSRSSGSSCCSKLADLVEQHFDELPPLDTLDMGAPISRTRGNAAARARHAALLCRQATSLHGETIENSLPGEIFSYTLKEPVGVVGAIIPWNGPLGASIWKIGPALATGCTVILKPAEEAPLTSLRLAELGHGGRQCRRASSTSCPATARPRVLRSPRIRTSTRSRSPARM